MSEDTDLPAYVGRVRKEFIVNRQGKDFVLYAGLIDQAHREGLKRITTTLIQAPTAANGLLAICSAEVETDKGTFSGIGDASPENVGRMIALHTVRMAETRAKARALRDAINVGVTCLDELGDVEDERPARPERPAPGPNRAQQTRPAAAQPPPQPAAAPARPAKAKKVDTDPAGEEERAYVIGLAHKLDALGGAAPPIPTNCTIGVLRTIGTTITNSIADLKDMERRAPARIPAHVGTP